MATKIKAISATVTAGGGGTTFDVTGFGFQPKAYLLFINGRGDASDSVGRANSQFGFGFFATKQTSAVSNVVDGGASSVGTMNVSSTEYLLGLEPTSGTFETLRHDSFLSDGVRIEKDIAFAADKKILVIAFGGEDVTNVWNGFKVSPTSTGDEDYTGFGFDPGDNTLLLFCGAMEAFNADPDPFTSGVSSGAQLTFGAVHTSDPTKQYVTCINVDVGAATMLTDSYSRKGECLANIPTAGGAGCDIRASFVQSITDGIRLNFADVQGTTRPFMILAIKGGNFALGDFVTKTDTSTDITASGLEFVPSSAFFVSHNLPQSSADTTQNGARFSFGACNDTSSEFALIVHDEDNTANQETNTAVRYSDVYGNIATDGTIQGAMRAQEFPTSDGFKMRMSDADDAENFVWFVTGGDPLLVETGNLQGGLDAWGALAWGEEPPAAGGGSQTLNVDSGTYSITGQAMTPRVGMPADSSSYSISGTDATLKPARKIAADSGTYSISGTAASLLKALKLAIDSGTYALSGQTAGLARQFFLVANGGVYSITGTAVTTKKDAKLALDSGSYIVAGSDVALSKGRTLVADGGVYSISGTDATLKPVRFIISGGGVYSIEGQTANLNKGRLLTADGGVYSLTGQNVNLRAARKLILDSGVYAVTGSTSGLMALRKLTAESGAYAVLGTAMTPRVTRKIAANGGSYSLLGTQAGLLPGRRIIAGGGSYSLTGVDAAFLIAGNKTLNAASGSYSISGTAADLIAPARGGSWGPARDMMDDDTALLIFGDVI